MSSKYLCRDEKGQLRLNIDSPKAVLMVEDGTFFSGLSLGKSGIARGELVFNTSLTGYQEILTDPSYAGQVVTLTYPEIGNYGVCDEDVESNKVHARGFVVRHSSRIYSNHRAKGSLHDFLVKNGVVGISDIDTREITRLTRDKGAMRCVISTEHTAADKEALLKMAREVPEMTGLNLTEEVTTKSVYKFGTGKTRIAVLDFGIKQNILRELAKRDCEATVYPASTKASEILKTSPDGIFLSNGPGDPAACQDILREIPKLIDSKIPIFGICLGHQLLSIALGARTFKLKFGHRGGNQPVLDLTTGKIEITSQNHGFAVDDKSIPAHVELTHVNLNDRSVEGFKHRELPIFAVQYHPESSPGPHDSSYLFDRFKALIAAGKIKDNERADLV